MGEYAMQGCISLLELMIIETDHALICRRIGSSCISLLELMIIETSNRMKSAILGMELHQPFEADDH